MQTTPLDRLTTLLRRTLLNDEGSIFDRRRSKRREGILNFFWRKLRLQIQFKRKCGYRGNFTWPRTYQEKVQYRKLWGNYEFYAMVADKYRVREYVANKVGARHLIPLLGVYEHLTAEVFAELPEQFVIKTNHGCSWNKIVWDKRQLDVEATVKHFNQIVQETYGRATGEFHYSLIEPKILIEELLLDGSDVPYDYNLFCYHGERGFDYATTIQRPHNKGAVHFDRNWNLLEGELMEGEREKYVNPANFADVLRIARMLSSDFDFARIDLYNVGGEVFFGEITLTPAAGFGLFANPHRAALRTQMWTLDVDNALLYRKPWARRLLFWRR